MMFGQGLKLGGGLLGQPQQGTGIIVLVAIFRMCATEDTHDRLFSSMLHRIAIGRSWNRVRATSHFTRYIQQCFTSLILLCVLFQQLDSLLEGVLI